MDALTESVLKRENVALSVVRALLGAVTPEIRRVGFALNGRSVQVLCVHEGSPSASLREAMNDVEGEISGDFAADVSVEAQLVRIDAPASIEIEAVWVYARKEVPKK
ncbi:hypothetical protein E5F05_06595 [Deinococcus metallilatus]|uniref:Uncharacterized protein n=1 Tax=Deinococcus metallilatus TaxID=1211322 RepID=A0AAJ5JZ86_9DEIO|nr:hypothetical protein [Deinococcus metallilatus]MBB5294615.1 hypothetical protein [Deinococcus metallilatus]QBY07653.1 hypothetical protein E5F05_06595 [Deinococcus metallilatus]RXJ14069.1 hypothetical protein ERJ73_05430 [Deinococcus metallilatus]TLK30034.1 hypothetical protein FCS05_05745 [Deinococcus metallilatus]GMA15828.1 hypothetical protein GCM10025871_21590 [Deinococcus metallilatus]